MFFRRRLVDLHIYKEIREREALYGSSQLLIVSASTTLLAMSYNPISVSFVFLLLSSSPFLSSSSSDSEVDNESTFSYKEGSRNGPKNWGRIDSQWKLCGDGKSQSPIDLSQYKAKVFPPLGKLRRNYKPAPAVIKNRGHDIMIHWKGDAGNINIDGTYYNLIQCHWHFPSEHTFNGTRFDLEIHLVHESSDKKTAAIAILYKYGHPDRLLSRVFNRIKSIGNRESDLGIINPGDIKFGSRKYFRYIGSLTVPPCTSGVVWTVQNKVRTVSREQVRALRDAVHDGFEENSRPTQELNGRTVWFFGKNNK